MNNGLLLGFVFGYFAILLLVAYITSRNSNNESFFIGNKNSNWMLVAFGMIGTSLSGVTFVSVPGGVGAGAFNYFQIVIGYFIGYIVIAYVLLPLYYKMNVTSIYKFLENRFGMSAHKTGASFFILSRTLGATARLYLVVNILQIFILDKIQMPWSSTIGIPFWLTAFVILLMILLYTFEGGVKTIVYTDTLQTSGMLIGLVVSIIVIMKNLNLDLGGTIDALRSKNLISIFNFNVNEKGFFLKQIIGGAFITIAMTGLDQEMMQKNISVKKLGDSQKNMMSFGTVLIFVNLLFLLLGGLLYLFAASKPELAGVKGDDLFPNIALAMDKNGVSFFPAAIGIIFIIALISALFPSVDGAITALTSCFCVDLANINTRTDLNEQGKKRFRLTVHLTFAVIFFILVLLFKWINEKNIIDFVLKIAGFTYGPLLGLFAFGILTKRKVINYWIPTVCIAALIITFYLDIYNDPQWYQDKFKLYNSPFIEGLKNISQKSFGGYFEVATIKNNGADLVLNKLKGGYKIGLELLLINGIFTFIGLIIISKKSKQTLQ